MSITNPTSSIKVKSTAIPKLSTKLSGMLKSPKIKNFSLSKAKVPGGKSFSPINFGKMSKIKIPKVAKVAILKKAVKKAKLPAY